MNCEVCIMNCATCNWFDPPLALEIGHCRKNPPATFRTGEDEYVSVFPEVHPEDWCGQWEGKADEKSSA